LSFGDIIENYIYGDQNWDMRDIHGFYTCVLPSYLMCHNADNNYRFRLEFLKDINKTSTKKINKKNIDNTDICFQDMNIDDYIYINKIVRRLVGDNRIAECGELLKGYKFKVEHIESLLKIDKIKSTKMTLTTKQKREFNNIL